MVSVPETVTLVRQMMENKFSVKSFQKWKGTCATEFQKAVIDFSREYGLYPRSDSRTTTEISS
jgi:hypothetical protein